MPLDSTFFRDRAFKQQLNIAVTVGVIFFAIASSLLISWQGSHQIRHTLLEQGEHIAGNLASQSKLALLYASAENANEAVKTALSFTDVTRVEIRHASGRPLVVRGKAVAEANDTPLADKTIRQAYLETETGDAWRFVAPVLSEGDDSPFAVIERKEEVLGFVRVVQSKATLSRMLTQIFLLNLLISLVFAVAFLFVMRNLAGRLTRPITDLSEAMARAERGEANVHADVSGPKDIRDMAKAFNSMITAQQERETALRESEERFSLFMDTLPAAAFIKNQDGITLYVNRYMANLLGGRDWLGKSTQELFPPELAEKIIADDRRSLEAGYSVIEEHVPGADGQSRLYQTHKFSIPRQGQSPLLGGIALDITERKASADKIEHLAFYDPLTDLPNRRLLLDRLQQALTSSARHNRYGALMLLDMDDFKTLNDTLGHDVGDRFLTEVASRLQACVREGDTVARQGGDEFVVILEDLKEDTLAAMQAESVAVKIQNAMRQPYVLDLTLSGGVENTRSYHCSSSIGITLFRDNSVSVDELMKRADTAMYQAKAAGRDTLRFFDPDMQAVVTARAALDSDLREAVKERQFLLYYQPQVDAAGRTTGSEALVRWQHPRRGMVSPADFIPLAEATGLILPIGLWVLETACEQLVAWATVPDMSHLTVAVNVSARQFRHPDFVDQVLAVLDSTGANPGKLKLELTESLLLDNVEDIIEKMTALKAKGIGFSLDDFGTGYSSLSYLKRLPLDQLKIDQSFVRDVLTDPNDATIARTIVALAQSMGLAVIAEGVETVAQQEFLAANGCNAYQGYLFGRPMPAAEFGTRLNQG
ncbi:MAG: EAL domain-containing protein [Sulfuritalea sp.]|jgi:diguanylate cyclase (GGDEF)-like protein/PAS domain S-box-containing protein|nr:EAL domain-containing protein [Sulfuritalea sp.]